jgi:hypothetical protein
MDAPTSMLSCALLAFLAAIAMSSLVNFSTTFKRSQQWQKKMHKTGPGVGKTTGIDKLIPKNRENLPRVAM